MASAYRRSREVLFWDTLGMRDILINISIISDISASEANSPFLCSLSPMHPLFSLSLLSTPLSLDHLLPRLDCRQKDEILSSRYLSTCERKPIRLWAGLCSSTCILYSELCQGPTRPTSAIDIVKILVSIFVSLSLANQAKQLLVHIAKIFLILYIGIPVNSWLALFGGLSSSVS
jgi:hypothetical protein